MQIYLQYIYLYIYTYKYLCSAFNPNVITIKEPHVCLRYHNRLKKIIPQ